MWRCPKCQRQNSDMDKFCSNCRTAKQGTLNKPVLLCLAMCVLGIIIIICSLGSCGDKGGTESTYKPTTNSVSTPRPTNKVVSTPKPTVKPVTTPKPTVKPVTTPKPTEKPVATPKFSVYDIVAACGDVENVGIPADKYVLDEYEVKYVKSGKGHSIYTYCDDQGLVRRPHYYIYEEQVVYVLAEYDGMSFVEFEIPNGGFKCAWVGSEWLVDEYK